MIKCFEGNDGDLQYFNQCTDCGTIIIVDYSNPKCMEDWECPVCNPMPERDFPWVFVRKEEIEKEPLLQIIIDRVQSKFKDDLDKIEYKLSEMGGLGQFLPSFSEKEIVEGFVEFIEEVKSGIGGKG